MPNRLTALARAAVLTVLAGGALGAQVPTHVYTLDNGSLADANGGPSLTLFGTNVAATHSSGARGFEFAAGGGFTLSNALATPTTYSIELRFLFDNVTDGYRKIVDFKNRGSDWGFYNLNSAARFYNVSGATGAAGKFADGTFATVVITRDDLADADAANDVFSAYVDGALQFSFVDGGGNSVFTAANNIIHFLHDDSAQGTEQSSGFVDYIRLYDGALTAQQVAALTAPGISNVPEPATVALLAGGLLGVGGIAARLPGGGCAGGARRATSPSTDRTATEPPARHPPHAPTDDEPAAPPSTPAHH